MTLSTAPHPPMLLLVFQIGPDRYALDTACVLEVVPRVTLRRLAHAPVGVAGLLDYHASPVPVLDLHEIVTGQPAEARLSTRLILVKLPAASGAPSPRPQIVGLLAERATGTLKRERSDFTETGLTNPNAPYLGPITADGEGFIQSVRVEGLVSGTVRSLLAAPQPEGQRP